MQPQIIILAGGSNSRFFPFNTTFHKGAIELLGKPLIVRTLENLKKNGFTNIIIVQSERDAKNGSLKKILSLAQLNIKIELIVQPQPKGMGNAILIAKEKIKNRFAVISPYLIDAGDLLSTMVGLNTSSVVCATETREPWLYGILEIYNNLALGITEKPPQNTEKSNQKVVSCYLLNKEIFSILENTPQAQYSFEEALNALMKKTKVGVKRVENSQLTLKFPWHLFNFQKNLFSRLQSLQAQSAVIAPSAMIDQSNGPVVIEKKAKIGSFAKISGPCYIGKNCLVGDYSFIRGSSLEGGSVVGAKAEVARSIIMGNSTFHFGYLADSIIGPNTKIGAGLISANKRFDRQSIHTLVQGIKTDTTRKSLGIIIGESVKIGIGVKTMPGVIIGAGVQIDPGRTIAKNMEHSPQHPNMAIN